MVIHHHTASAGDSHIFRLYPVYGGQLYKHTRQRSRLTYLLESLGRRQLRPHRTVRLPVAFRSRLLPALPADVLAALFVIYQLAADVAGDEVAHRTLLYLCIFPTALFFFAAYNESLFILLTAGAFLAMRRQRWWLVGILGFFAALTRAAGVLLVVPYLYELWLARESVTARLRNIAPALLPLLLIPLGIALYCFYCWKLTGDPIAFATVQYRWSRHLAWPWQGIWQALFELFWNQPFGSFFEAHIVLDLSATLGFIALAAFGWRKVRTSYTLWTALLILMMLLSPSLDQHDSLISNQRLVLEMFPAFITLSMLTIRHPRLHQTLLLLFPTLLATLSVLFVMYKWVV